MQFQKNPRKYSQNFFISIHFVPTHRRDADATPTTSMHIEELSGKSICILGFGREGQATARALEKYATGCRVTIADQNCELRIANCECQLGDGYLKNLDHFDVIIKSPGIPPHPELKAQSSKLTTATQIFLDSIADSGATVVGVTGSKGKSTTASLIYEILKAHSSKLKAQSYLIGNIGEPALDHLDDAKPGAIFVMEMSSYQLMDLTRSPHIAMITTFFPEHLDYHGSESAYMEAKKHITRFQRKNDVVFYNSYSDGAREIAMESSGTRVPFSADECPVPIEETHLIGDHNRSNIAAAYKVALHLKCDPKIAVAAIKKFKGLPHRLQSLGIHHGIEWIDDAISTTPESTIAALDALGDRVTTIILGGQDRGNDFSELGRRIVTSSIEHVILFPGSGGRIREAIEVVMTEKTPPPKPPSNQALSPRPPLPAGRRGGFPWHMSTNTIVKKVTDKLRYPPATVVAHAREMRKKPTKAEQILWERLRNRKMDGFYFRRQRPIGPFIVDFFCDKANLAIELDGGIHNDPERAHEDAMREEELMQRRVILLRFRNEEVLSDIETAIKTIKEHIHTPPPAGGGVRGGGLPGRRILFHPAPDMQKAISLAKSHTRKGTICLLSTASPSYGMFKNFEEKGEQFKNCILK